MMAETLNPNRRILEQSGEVIRSSNPFLQQNTDQEEQTTEWDSLKDVPFRGEQASEEEDEEMEMGM